MYAVVLCCTTIYCKYVVLTFITYIANVDASLQAKFTVIKYHYLEIEILQGNQFFGNCGHSIFYHFIEISNYIKIAILFNT